MLLMSVHYLLVCNQPAKCSPRLQAHDLWLGSYWAGFSTCHAGFSTHQRAAVTAAGRQAAFQELSQLAECVQHTALISSTAHKQTAALTALTRSVLTATALLNGLLHF